MQETLIAETLKCNDILSNDADIQNNYIKAFQLGYDIGWMIERELNLLEDNNGKDDSIP